MLRLGTCQFGSMLTWEERYQLVVADFDINVQFQLNTRVNILVQQVHEQIESTKHQFSAIIGEPGLPNASDFAHFVSVKPHQPTGTIATIVCQQSQIPLLQMDQKDFQILAGIYVEAVSPLTFYLDEQSVIYSPTSYKRHSVTSIDFFAGGFGGWKMASQFLKMFHEAPITRTFALDFDHRAIQNWVMNFGGNYIETTANIPWELIELYHGNIAVVADIHSNHWKQASAVFNPNLATISAPCVSWSGANSQKGLYSEGGLLMVASLMQCKFLRPRVILLEQVRNFEAHRHFAIVTKLITAIGYRIVFQKVLDASDTSPMHRQRWIAIACDTLSKHDFDLKDFPPKWLGDMYQTPLSFGCMMPIPEDEKQQMRLTDEIMRKYFDNKYAPACMRNNLPSKRANKVTQKMPTLMASYGKQHAFSDKELQTHGLYGHFLVEQITGEHSKLRLWHPLELAIMFLPVKTVSINKQHVLAWKHLGNAIATNHACYAFVASLALLLHSPPEIGTREALLSLLDQRLNKKNATIVDLEKCWIITQPEMIEEESQRIQHFLNTITSEVGAIPSATFLNEQSIVTFAQVRQIWNLTQSIPDMIPITSTVRDWLQLEIHIDEKVFLGANIKPMVAVEQILGIWNFKATTKLRLQQPDEESTHFQKLVIGQQHEANQHGTEDEANTFLIYHSQQAWFYRIKPLEQGQIMQDMSSDVSFHNALQKLSLAELPKTDTVLYAELPPIQESQLDPCQLMYLIPTINCHVHARPGEDTLIILIDVHRDVTDPDDYLTTFWQAALPFEWMSKHGRQIQLTHRPKALEIHFVPNQQVVPLPIPDALEVVMFHALRTFLSILSDHTLQPAIEIRLKWNGHALWKGPLPSTTMIIWLRSVIRCFTDPITGNLDISFVAYGQRAGDFLTLQNLKDRNPKALAPSMLIAVTPEISGGGPTKTQWDVQIKNQLAATLLPIGIPVEQIAPMADAIMNAVGRPKLQHILKHSSQAEQKQQLIDLASKAGFSIETMQKTFSKPQPLLKKPRADQIRQELQDMDFEGVQFEPGFFHDDQNEAIRQIDRLIPKTTGIMLTKQHQIQDWISSSSIISPDPLAAFVVGTQHINTSLHQQALLVPARTKKGQPLIISGTLVQFGERSMLYSPQTADDGFQCTTDTQVVSITAWKEEIPSEHWNELLRRPLVTLQHAFMEQGPMAPFLSTWGVSYHAKNKPVDKHQAESIQIHASIERNKLPDLLRKSGIQGIYATPKTQQGMPEQEWKIIWLSCPVKTPGTREEALRMLSKLSQPYGLVRNKVSYGIRVHSDQYEESWATLKPQEPMPATVANKTVFKVTPLPSGCPPETVRQWMRHIGWDGTVIKPVGPKSWLIAANTDPPAQFHTFNGTPTLIRKLPPKDVSVSPAIVAGPRLQSPHAAKDPMQQPANDPWATYKPMTLSQSSSGCPVKPTEHSVGIVQKQMQKQDDKIQALTDEMSQLRSIQQTNQTEVKKQIQAIETNVDQTKVAFTTQLTQMKTELETTFQQALSSQNAQITTGFAELKQMFMQNRGAATRRTHEEMERGDDQNM